MSLADGEDIRQAILACLNDERNNNQTDKKLFDTVNSYLKEIGLQAALPDFTTILDALVAQKKIKKSGQYYIQQI